MEWIVTSSVLILIVALLRLALKGRISLRLQYALWALVLVRLLCPVNFVSSPTSVLNVAKEAAAQPEIRNVIENVQEPIRFESKGYEIDPQTGESTPVTSTYYMAPSNDMNNPYSTGDILMRLWITGVVLTFGFMLTCNVHFRRKIRMGRTALEVTQTSLPVYVSDRLETPCMFGLFRPAIYLTPETVEDGERLRHVLEHELTHYYHGDYITAPLRCIALALHWYNPMVWWAAKASRLDGELACDEGTIARLGEGERTSYGKTLIQMTCNHRHFTDVMLTATTMCGSKYSIKERITRIAKKPHMAALTVAVVVLTALIAVGCTFTGASDGMSESLKQEIREHGKEYLTEVNFSLVQEEGQEPYGLLFLPEYMPKEGLTLELKSVKKDGSEEILHTQDTIKLGEKYMFRDLENYGELKLTIYYVVDGKAIDKRQSYVNLEEMQDSQKDFQMVNSVKKLMSDYAGDYFSAKVEEHNNQLFLPEEEKYNGVSYSEPNQIVTPMASGQNLYLYKIEAVYPRADGEKVEDQVYILMHWNGENWEYVTRATQETIDSYDTQEMQDKYSGSYYDAAAIELYLKHRDDAVDLDGMVRINVIYPLNTASGYPMELVNIVDEQIKAIMTQDYPDRSVDVNVTALRTMELNPDDPSFQLCYLEFYPQLADGGRGMDYEQYLVITEDEEGKPNFLRAYEASIFSNSMAVEGYDNMDDTAKAMIWRAMLEQEKQTEAEQAAMFVLLQEVENPSAKLTLSLNGGQPLEGRSASNSLNLAMMLASANYSTCLQEEAELSGNYVCVHLPDSGKTITYYESGYAVLEDGAMTGYFDSHSYTYARIWYDEVELAAELSTTQMVTEDIGQSPEEAALELYRDFENMRTRLSDGSRYKWSYVNISLQVDEKQTAQMRSEGKIEENSWCFYATTIFVPENEWAKQLAWESSGVLEYEGEDTSVPAEALQYTRMGVIVQHEQVWICQLLPEEWY